VSRGFVMLPHDLLESGLSPTAILLWAVIRRSNGENTLQPCWASLKTLDKRLPGCNGGSYVSSRIRRAQKELRDRGLLVVRRRKTNSAFRWALRLGAHGEIELRELWERRDIDYQLYAETLTLRGVSVPPDGPSAPGTNPPTHRLAGDLPVHEPQSAPDPGGVSRVPLGDRGQDTRHPPQDATPNVSQPLPPGFDNGTHHQSRPGGGNPTRSAPAHPHGEPQRDLTQIKDPSRTANGPTSGQRPARDAKGSAQWKRIVSP
jgi:hypothetical protein